MVVSLFNPQVKTHFSPGIRSKESPANWVEWFPAWERNASGCLFPPATVVLGKVSGQKRSQLGDPAGRCWTPTPWLLFGNILHGLVGNPHLTANSSIFAPLPTSTKTQRQQVLTLVLALLLLVATCRLPRTHPALQVGAERALQAFFGGLGWTRRIFLGWVAVGVFRVRF